MDYCGFDLDIILILENQEQSFMFILKISLKQ